MDNINVAVLIIALVFVAAGVTLIALSALVGRGSPAPTPDSGATDQPAQPAPAEEGPQVLFIDEPLTTDLAEELAEPERGSRRGAPAENAATGVEAPAGSETVGSETAGSATVEEVQVAAEPETVDGAEAPGAAAVEAEAGRVGGAFDFSVQLGFKYLDNDLVSEAVAEFQKAAALTDDRAVKLSLYARIGDTLRERGMDGPAYAAYLQATAYADDHDTRAHLERTMSEMTDAGPDSDDAPGSSGGEKE